MRRRGNSTGTWPVPIKTAVAHMEDARAMTQKYSLNVNGKVSTVEADEDMPLLYALRNDLGLNNPHFGCGLAQCGACTVHLDGQPIRSCVTPVSSIEGKRVVTIEGIGNTSQGKTAHAVRAAWVDKDVVQCGYCQSGQVMSAIALLQKNKNPSDADIDAAMSGNICR